MKTIEIENYTLQLLEEIAAINDLSIDEALYQCVMEEAIRGNIGSHVLRCSKCGKPCHIVADLDMSECCHHKVV